MSIHKPISTGLATLGVLACGLLMAALPAQALETRKLIAPAIGELGQPTGVAINQATGNVYVADNLNQVVDVFGPEGGAPIGGVPSQITGAETPGESFIFQGGYRGTFAGVAVDNSCYSHELTSGACASFDQSNEDVYVPDTGDKLPGHDAVDRFTLTGSKEYKYACQFVGFSGFSGDASACLEHPQNQEFIRPLAVAVDTNGNVYVASAQTNPSSSNERGERVFEYNSAGHVVGEVNTGCVRGVAVDRAGNIYTLGCKIEGVVQEFHRNSSGEVEPGELGMTLTQRATGIAFDLARERLLVDLGSHIEELNANHEVVGSFGQEAGGELQGLAINEATDEVYVANVMYEGMPPQIIGGAVDRFSRPVVLADVSTGVASSVHRTSATVEGVLKAHGLSTNYRFQYGETTEYGSVTPSGSTKITEHVTAGLSGLQPGMTYHYRLVAENENGASYLPRIKSGSGK